MAKRPPQERERLPNWISEHIPDELATSALFRFEVKMPDGSLVDVDLLQDIDIDYELLEIQLQHTPSQFTWYAALLAELKTQIYVLERKCKVKRGRLTIAALDTGREVGVKPSVCLVESGARSRQIGQHALKCALKYQGWPELPAVPPAPPPWVKLISAL